MTPILRWLRDNWKQYAVLLAALVVGLLLVAKSEAFAGTAEELVKKFGIALAVAALLRLYSTNGDACDTADDVTAAARVPRFSSLFAFFE